jgi:hypothetical protein
MWSLSGVPGWGPAAVGLLLGPRVVAAVFATGFVRATQAVDREPAGVGIPRLTSSIVWTRSRR